MGGSTKRLLEVVGGMTKQARTLTSAAGSFLLLVALVVAGCGGEDDFENKPRPPVPVQLTGVINDREVTVSPGRLGAGPVVLIVSNQTQQSHTVTLEGEDVRETVGPINPLDTATIQKTLKPGAYEVRAGSEQATARPISAAVLDVGPPRPGSSDETLLP